jgi:hypothetical protein
MLRNGTSVPNDVKIWVIGSLLAIVVSGRLKAPPDPDQPEGAVQVAAVDTIRRHLREGNKGRFRSLKTLSHQGVAIVCGEVDASNGLGVASGFAPFIYCGDTGRYLIRQPVFPSEFEEYRVTCADAPGHAPLARPREGD